MRPSPRGTVDLSAVMTALGRQARRASFRNRGRLHPGSRSLRPAKWVPLLRLDLNGSAVIAGGAGNDH
jgi:hypothetical protein